MTVVSPPRRRVFGPGWVLIGVLAVVAVLLAAMFVAILVAAFDDDRDGRGSHVVTGPRDDRTEATVELLSGATAVTVRAVDLGGPLYRVRTPDDGKHVPEVTDRDGLVRVQLVDAGRAGPSTVDIELSTATRWRVRLLGGATRQTVDLSSGKVAEVDLVGGATSIDLALPAPAGTVPVRMVSGVSTWTVALPGGVPVRLFVGSGAGTVTIDGATRSGVSGGTTLDGPDWDAATDRYDVTASGGMSTFTLDRR